MLKSLISIGIVTLLWAFVGYSLVFSQGNAFIGGLEFSFLRGVTGEANATYSATLPQQSFMIFQLMFAIITPALITGAFAERIRFPAKLAFTTLWDAFDLFSARAYGLGRRRIFECRARRNISRARFCGPERSCIFLRAFRLSSARSIWEKESITKTNRPRRTIRFSA